MKMSLLTLTLILISFPVFAQTSAVKIYFQYDHQNVQAFMPDTVTVEVNGEHKCSDDSPVINTGTNEWLYSCPWESFDPGTYQVRLIITDVSGTNNYTNVEEITIPEPPPELPDRIDPIITGHEVIET